MVAVIRSVNLNKNRMALSQSARKTIEKEANAILAELKITKPPVVASLLFSYIEKKFGPVVEAPISSGSIGNKKIEGFVQSGKGMFIIGWDAKREKSIQDYIKIHEVGHILYNHGDSFRKSVGGYQNSEEICDYFALCVVVNPKMLKRYWKINQNILSLANIFETSPAYISKMLSYQGLSN